MAKKYKSPVDETKKKWARQAQWRRFKRFFGWRHPSECESVGHWRVTVFFKDDKSGMGCRTIWHGGRDSQKEMYKRLSEFFNSKWGYAVYDMKFLPDWVSKWI